MLGRMLVFCRFPFLDCNSDGMLNPVRLAWNGIGDIMGQVRQKITVQSTYRC